MRRYTEQIRIRNATPCCAAMPGGDLDAARAPPAVLRTDHARGLDPATERLRQ